MRSAPAVSTMSVSSAKPLLSSAATISPTEPSTSASVLPNT